MRFPRRALVALGLTIGAVAMTAVPAFALTALGGSAANFGTANWGATAISYDVNATGHPVYSAATAEKDRLNNTDEATCSETWYDLNTITHRPPDVFVDCRTGVFGGGVVVADHWPETSGAPWRPVYVGDLSNYGLPTVECRVDVHTFARTSANCAGDLGGAGAVTTVYNGTSYYYMQHLDCSCEGSHGLDRPEYMLGNIDVLPQGQTMFGGDLLVSWNGFYRAVMQGDGNFVVYAQNNTVLWSSGTSGHSGAKLVLQGSDGNLVIYSSTGTPLWSSGIYGGPGMKLQILGGGCLSIENSTGASMNGC